MSARGELFTYVGLDVTDTTLTARFDLDGRKFTEVATFEGVGALTEPAPRAVATLWYLLAGLSYYKSGAARRVDLASTPITPSGRALLGAALHDGLAEFAYRNEITLDDVAIDGGVDAPTPPVALDAHRVLTPFGGGIDSVVTACELKGRVDQALFIVSPASGRFTPLEETAQTTGLPIVRVARSLDPQLLGDDPTLLHGHVPVTAMITLLASTAAVASGRGGVVMSNEHSASSPNLRRNGADVNHQWSKSWLAEQLIADAVDEAFDGELVVASYLRDRSELWVAAVFSHLTEFHHVFRSCNRAFTQSNERRASAWCGECDKCLFINLVLAPFLPRATLREIFAGEPLSDPARAEQLRTLVGLGAQHKPFECVGDPDESAVALAQVSALGEWADVTRLDELAQLISPDRDFADLLTPQGPSRVPAHWLR
ncbi:MAG: hypothetical protein WA786_07765 [Acidimicrobiales bacterium]